MSIHWDDLTEEQKLLCSPQAREPMADRRHRETVEVVHVWSPFTTQEIHEELLVSIGRRDDGRIGEVFLDGRERGQGKVAQRETALRQDVAVLISIALQYGAPIDVLAAGVGRGEVNVMGKILKGVPHTIIGTVLDTLAAEAAQ